ncbi:Regulatory protein RecX [Moorella glycerini]|uniref:Regulatory protein RecX n=1 Tax=Neomoorella stamsii TaxID=1266720 RepID=A0A9X7P5I7_9FIRM|nr:MULTISPECIES: regulatory protein RecX [Moorella]PRR71490.1 Regulatory protein RecX [Moorella stamsii]CEP68701.1 Regulatory protein RecX [Moorella glycerini]
MKVRKTNNPSPAAAWEYALKILTRRQQSEQEMCWKLQAKGFPREVVVATLNRLKDAGLLDDASFARDWAAYRLATHPVGPRRLRRELQEHGVAPSLAEGIAGDLFPPEAEMAAARELAGKYHRRQGESPDHYYQRLARFLWQRGFNGHVIRQVLGELAEEDNYIDSNHLNL